MNKELFWIILALIIIMGAMIIAAAVLILHSRQPNERKQHYPGASWLVELWNIGCGCRMELRFTNTYILGRLSMYDHVSGCWPVEPDQTVSREHCMLYDQDGALWAWNMSAVNPAAINGFRLNQPVQVMPGDRLEMGSSVYLITRVERIS